MKASGNVPGLSAGLAGVVVALPEPYASELRSWRASFGDPLADVVPAHITLVTATPIADWREVTEHVRAVAAEQRCFQVTLRGTGGFRPVSPVVFLRVETGFGDCVALHERLQRGPLERELPFPFHPHVTVAHDISEAAMDDASARLRSYEASFHVASMGLYEHGADGVWTLREELDFGCDEECQTSSPVL